MGKESEELACELRSTLQYETSSLNELMDDLRSQLNTIKHATENDVLRRQQYSQVRPSTTSYCIHSFVFCLMESTFRLHLPSQTCLPNLQSIYNCHWQPHNAMDVSIKLYTLPSFFFIFTCILKL